MPANKAAYLLAHDSPLSIQEAPYPNPTTTQLVIRVHAIAINPVDYGTQSHGSIIFPWLKLPYILGSDISGEVISIGPDVKSFKPGDRIVGQSLNFQHNNAEEGAYQEYVLVWESMIAKIPDSLKFEQAAVLPLGLSTAASGLFEKRFLGLEFPALEEKEREEWLLIWGGSTSVGCNAVQLAAAAGYQVVSTASPKNFELVRNLGAKEVFNHNKEETVEDIIKYLDGKKIAGAYAIGSPTTDRNGFSAGEACLEIVRRSQGRKFVAMAMVGPAELAPKGVEAKFVTGENLKSNEVGKTIYGDFLPKALAAGKYVCAPEPLVVGHGLEKIQEALDTLRKGVSARKIVVTL